MPHVETERLMGLSEPTRALPDLAEPKRWSGVLGWRPIQPARAGLSAGVIVIFNDRAGLGSALATRLRAQGRRVLTVCRVGDPKATADVRLDPFNLQHFRDVRQTLEASRAVLAAVIDLWALDVEPDEAGVWLGAVALHRTVAAAGLASPPRVWMVTQGLWSVGAEAQGPLAQALAWGLQRGARSEHPSLRSTCVDLDAAGSIDEGAKVLSEALLLEASESELVHRSGRWWALRYEPLGETELASPPAMGVESCLSERDAEVGEPRVVDAHETRLLRSWTWEELREVLERRSPLGSLRDDSRPDDSGITWWASVEAALGLVGHGVSAALMAYVEAQVTRGDGPHVLRVVPRAGLRGGVAAWMRQVAQPPSPRAGLLLQDEQPMSSRLRRQPGLWSVLGGLAPSTTARQVQTLNQARLHMASPAQRASILAELVRQRVAGALGRAPAELGEADDFLALGLDSVGAVALADALSDELGLALGPTLALERPTLGALTAAALDALTVVDPPSPLTDPAAIIGTSCRFSGGLRDPMDLHERWDGSPLAAVAPSEALGFDAGLFGMKAVEAAGLSSTEKLALELTWEALERAGVVRSELPPGETGVFWGLNAPCAERCARTVAQTLGVGGCVVTVHGAHASMLAVHLAVQSLRTGESAVAIAGGITGDGSQGGAVVLRRLTGARREGDRVVALVHGTAAGLPRSGGSLVEGALNEGALTPTVAVELEGASGEGGAAAIATLFAWTQGLGLGQPPALAHTSEDAGSATRVAVCVRDEAGDGVALVLGRPPTALAPQGRAGVGPRTSTSTATLLLVSAHDGRALRGLSGRMAAWLRRPEAPLLYDVAHTLGRRRAQLSRRAMVVAANADGAAQGFAALEQGLAHPRTYLASNRAGDAPRVAWLFGDVEVLWKGGGRALYATEPTFRTAIDGCDRVFNGLLGWSIKDVLGIGEGASREGQLPREISEPLTFAFHVALANTLRAKGELPKAVFGLGVGEVSAAYVSGALGFREAAAVIHARCEVAGRSSAAPDASSMESALSGGLQPGPTAVSVYSPTTGREVSGRALVAAHWAASASRPPLISEALEAMLGDGVDVVVELSPHAQLGSTLEECAARLKVELEVIEGFRREREEVSDLLAVWGRLFCAGAHVDLAALFSERRPPVELPAYPWLHERCWVNFTPTGVGSAQVATSDADTELLDAPLRKTLIRLAVPETIGYLSSFAWTAADTWFISQLGEDALAAMAFGAPVGMLVFHLALGPFMGQNASVSQARGEAGRGGAQVALRAGFLPWVGFGLLSGAVSGVAIDAMGVGLGVPPEMMGLFIAYSAPFCWGAAALCALRAAVGTLLASGDTKATGGLMILTGLVNLVLDPLLIWGLGPVPAMGLAGAAWATVISWGVAFVLAMLRLRWTHDLDVSPRGLWPRFRGGSGRDLHWLKVTARVGGLGVVSNALAVFVQGGVTRALAVSGGPMAIAAYGVATRLIQPSQAGLWAVASAVAPLSGQAYGARRLEVMHRAVKEASGLSIAWGVLCAIALAVVAKPVAALFTSEPEVIALAALYLWVVPFSLGVYNVVIVAATAMNTIGRAAMATGMMVASNVLKLVCMLAGGVAFGPLGTFAGDAIANLLIGVLGWVSARWGLPHEHEADAAA